MKKLLTVTVLLLVIAIVAATSCSAAAKVLGFSIDTATIGYSATSSTLFVGDGLWSVDVTAATTLTATEGNAALDGDYVGGKVWKFIYHDATGWNDLVTMIDSSVATPVANSVTLSDKQGPFVVQADAFAIGYNFDLTGTDAAASGTAGLVATAVPEPSSAVALLTGVAGIVGIIKRRRG